MLACIRSFTSSFMTRDQSPVVVDFLAGIAGGCAGVLAGHPLDTVKVRLQNQHGSHTFYRGTWHCIAQTVRHEGLFGLYKGMSSPLIGVAVINSILFGVYGWSMALMHQDQSKPTLPAMFVAGSISGAVNCIICCPMELVKIRLQNQSKPPDPKYPHYKGPIDCIQQIMKHERGARGLFTGMHATFWRDSPSYGVYFASYEMLSRLMLPNGLDTDHYTLRVLTAGGLAGVVGWMSTYPVDVVKTRLQSVEQSITKEYSGMTHCFKEIIRKEGYRALFAGGWATCVRAFPTNAATFYAFSLVKSWMNDKSS